MAQAPAFAIFPILDNSSPFCPFVIAPIGKTCITPSLCAFNLIYSTIISLSHTGLVFGMQQIVVNPPFAALLVPVAIVSLYSYPGSRK